MISSKIRVDVRLRRNGTWAVAAYDAAIERLTLVQGDERQAARAVLLSRDLCTEALVGDMPCRSGIGRARVTARVSATRATCARKSNVYFRTARYAETSVQREPDGGKSNTQWVFPNGSRAKVHQEGNRRSIALIHRDGKVVSTREVLLKHPNPNLIEADTIVSNGAGRRTGRVSSRLTVMPNGGSQRTMEERTDLGSDGAETSYCLGTYGLWQWQARRFLDDTS